jgi:hypothetical protein
VGSDISSHPSGSASSVVVSSILPIILFLDAAIDLLAADSDAVAADEEFFHPGGGSH